MPAPPRLPRGSRGGLRAGLVALVLVLLAAAPTQAAERLTVSEARAKARALGQHSVDEGFAERFRVRDCRRRAKTRVTCTIREFGMWILSLERADEISPAALVWEEGPLDFPARLYRRRSDGLVYVRGPYFFLCPDGAGDTEPC